MHTDSGFRARCLCGPLVMTEEQGQMRQGIMLLESLQFLKWYEKYTTMHLQQNIIVDTINYSISISQIQICKLQQTNCSEVFFLLIIHMES